MKPVMYGVNEVTEMLAAGKKLLLAGDTKLLSALPRGQWIGGSIPYFMAENGGVCTADKLYITELPSYVQNVRICRYDKDRVANVYVDMPAHGFSVIMIPAFSPTHSTFALNAPTYKDFASQPLVGWITGVNLQDIGKCNPSIADGSVAQQYSDGAIVMHVDLPEDKVAQLDILNIFQQGDGDVIEFTESGFEARDAIINGQRQSLAAYLQKNKISLELPLVADYAGALVNISIQSVDDKTQIVKFYAPVFHGAQYTVAKQQQGGYIENFTREMAARADTPMLFSCNCILNYLYAGLEGNKTGTVTGPITFGEIAYQLLNQTMVYLTVTDI